MDCWLETVYCYSGNVKIEKKKYYYKHSGNIYNKKFLGSSFFSQKRKRFCQ